MITNITPFVFELERYMYINALIKTFVKLFFQADKKNSTIIISWKIEIRMVRICFKDYFTELKSLMSMAWQNVS